APVAVGSSMTLKAIAYKTGLNDSTVAAASYTINETIATPSVTGATSGLVGVGYAYRASGAVSSLNHQVQYQFNWSDGTNSGWLPAGATSTSHTWTTAGTYSVTVQARCAVDTSSTSF